MRLLNTTTYDLHEEAGLPHQGKPLPPYAILSHTWLPDGSEGVKEVTYQDMKTSFRLLKSGKFKPEGWGKLVSYCNRAAKDGWEWAWMDTCCIDKTNVGDTQEAINAMFRWYEASMVCYAYLADVNIGDSGGARTRDVATQELQNDIVNARWFTRGWTLQELLAPKFFLFVDQQWREIGTRERWAEEIEKATKIAPRDMENFQLCPIAKRLSWASERQTTLVEDHAYSLLGLFRIAMPLIYGEGDRAFVRFQQELIKTYDDASLFAWRDCLESLEETRPRQLGILAPSVAYFKQGARIGVGTFYRVKPEFSISNRGLHLKTDLMILKTESQLSRICFAKLNWWAKSDVHYAPPGEDVFDTGSDGPDANVGIYLLVCQDYCLRIGFRQDLAGPMRFWNRAGKGKVELKWTEVRGQSIIIKQGHDLDIHAQLVRLSYAPEIFDLEVTMTSDDEGEWKPKKRADVVLMTFNDEVNFEVSVIGRQDDEYILLPGRSIMQNEDIHIDMLYNGRWDREFVIYLKYGQNRPSADLSLSNGPTFHRDMSFDSSIQLDKWTTITTRLRPTVPKPGRSVTLSFTGYDTESEDDEEEPAAEVELERVLVGEMWHMRSLPLKEYELTVEHLSLNKPTQMSRVVSLHSHYI